ncbi:DUF3168 domain-containing protein [Devosia rhodophyticola]|uniref:DUF3168 domain-containing protein n=1 Tax=Devosia rhodophyticola TaxID=3026423 RepID=A0ABY7Z2H1_9HYPH|nr:DUF3168 domain-containing protein [Devosia rhodophyticola]WDR07299.1 DUF3168 domain-containing protein [Devosia rhodophyticola]
MSADLALQKAIRARLVASSPVLALVPAANILDRNARPDPDPAIVIGESHAVDEGDVARKHQRIYATLHIWKREVSLTGAKAIGGTIRTAIGSSKIVLDTGFHCADCRVSDMRFLRDPDGETSHGIVTVEALVGDA